MDEITALAANLSRNIRHLRLARGLSQAQLAALADLPRGTLVASTSTTAASTTSMRRARRTTPAP